MPQISRSVKSTLVITQKVNKGRVLFVSNVYRPKDRPLAQPKSIITFTQGLKKSLKRGVTNSLTYSQRVGRVFIKTANNQLVLGQGTVKSLGLHVQSSFSVHQNVGKIETGQNQLIVSQFAEVQYLGVLVCFAQSNVKKALYVPGEFDIRAAWIDWKEEFRGNHKSTWGRDFLHFLTEECGCMEVNCSNRVVVLNNQSRRGYQES